MKPETTPFDDEEVTVVIPRRRRGRRRLHWPTRRQSIAESDEDLPLAVDELIERNL